MEPTEKEIARMSQQSTVSSARRIIGYVSLVLLFFFLVGLFSVDLSAGLTTLAGAVIFFLLTGLWRILHVKNTIADYTPIWLSRGGFPTQELASVLVRVAICVTIFSFVWALLPSQKLPVILPPLCPISYYRVVAIPETDQVRSIRIHEFVVLDKIAYDTPPSSWIPTYVDDQAGFQLPEKTATIEQKGILLKEVNFQSSILCSNDTFVVLSDFPSGSFFAAHYAQDLQKYPYVDSETITWNSSYKNVRFSYVLPPFHVIRPILNPLMGVSSTNQWFMGFIGIIGTAILVPIFKPVLTEIVQESVKKRIGKKVRRGQTAKLIIVDHGEEKEIEIKTKHRK